MSNERDHIFQVQTVPPPPGETDAYSAPTKVGAMANTIMNEIVEHARRRALTPSWPVNVETNENDPASGAITAPPPAPLLLSVEDEIHVDPLEPIHKEPTMTVVDQHSNRVEPWHVAMPQSVLSTLSTPPSIDYQNVAVGSDGTFPHFLDGTQQQPVRPRRSLHQAAIVSVLVLIFTALGFAGAFYFLLLRR